MMNTKTLNRITSAFCVLISMMVAINISMMTGSMVIAWFGAWVGIYLGQLYFSNIDWWTKK